MKKLLILWLLLFAGPVVIPDQSIQVQAQVMTRPVISQYTPPFVADFTTGTLPAGVSFSRSSAGTYFDASGILQTASINTPRFDYDPITLAAKGLLIEESRTNVLNYSEQLDNAYWNKGNASISANVTTALDGASTGDKLVDNTTNGVHEIARAYNSVSGTSYVLSVFVKKAERGFLFLKTQDGNKGVGFNLTTATVSNAQSASGKVIPLPNGWYRCIMFFTGNSTTTTTFEIGSGNASTDWTANGDYRYVGDGGGLTLWGVDLQTGGFETSYIAVVASAVTRAADNATLTGISTWYNQNYSTFLINYQLLPGQTNAYTDAFSVNNGSGAHEIVLYAKYTGSVILNTPVNGVYAGQIQASYLPANFTNPFRVAVAVSNNSSAMVVNGTVYTANTGVLPTGLSQVTLGRARNNTNLEYLNGWISRFMYYPRRMPNQYLQSLTQ